MTHPSSGPLSLAAIADEFGLPRNTPFPSGFYGRGGAPSSGALSISDFYGRSNFTLSANKTAIFAYGYGASDQATITSTVPTTASRQNAMKALVAVIISPQALIKNL